MDTSLLVDGLSALFPLGLLALVGVKYVPSDWIEEPTLYWKAADGGQPWRVFEFTSNRLAYVLQDDAIRADSGSIKNVDGTLVLDRKHAVFGMPLRNQRNRVDLEWEDARLVIALRETDAFGEVLLDLHPAQGTATVYSITINRIMKGGVSHSSPMPEEQRIARIGRFTFAPLAAGRHRLEVAALEEQVIVSVDGQVLLAFADPDVAGGYFALGSSGVLRIHACDQVELIRPEERAARERFVQRMRTFAEELDAEYDTDVAARNEIVHEADGVSWRSPDTGARLVLRAENGALSATLHAGLYGDARLLAGPFAAPRITAAGGAVYILDPRASPALDGSANRLSLTLPLRGPAGERAELRLTAELTENTVWFWTAEVDGIEVEAAELLVGLDADFAPNRCSTDFGEQLTVTDHVVGHHWQRISGQDTTFAVRTDGDGPRLAIRSVHARFRWASMWLPSQKLNLTGYKKRMLHFIRYPETPVQDWRERPSVHEYPTDEELERYARNGVDAMVWHHTWTSNNYRKRDGFVVNETEMRRAMRKAHKLGIAVIGYIGVVPGRHPALRYEDQACHMDKNWDLQDFTSYSVAGRFAEFLPYMTDHWCREYGLDGFYADGGLAGMTWGFTGHSEETCDGKSLEELNHRFYSRIKRVLRRHHAGFGLENWGGGALKLVNAFYDCRMIGETFQEAAPESYRDGSNPLLTGTPFKMYGMDLTARNRYNIAMAAVCMTDIQLCSGNYAWGNWPDRPSDWHNLRPWWKILDGIDWDHLTDARPWWAQRLVAGEGFYAGNYTTPQRAVFFLANRTEEPRSVRVTIETDALPQALRRGRCRQIYPEPDTFFPLGGPFEAALPRLHDGPVGFEIVPQ